MTVLVALCGAVFVSALGVLYTQHLSRTLIAEVQQQRQLRDELNIGWGRLLLEHSTWASHGRIERLAREQLGMHNPSFAEIEVATP